MTVRVALDAMGGDHAPDEIIAGGLLALVDDPELELILVGRTEEIDRQLEGKSRNRVTVHHATEVVEMDEHPAAAVRTKKDSSINVAARLVSAGAADALVSAGNSGGVMAAAIFVMKRLPGLERPAIVTPIPSRTGVTLLLDSGANTDVRPEYLAQFALLGEAYARKVLGIAHPKVALLSNGEEDTKGNELTLAAHALIRALPINFVGNIEGKDLMSGAVDVAVTDGFTGNIVLKTVEGVADFLFTTIRDEVKRTPLGIAGGLLLKPSLGKIKARADWRRVGGAPLLGVNGACVIAHGRSDAEATRWAVRRGAELVRSDVIKSMAAAISGEAVG
ncbi:MAG: phosphate acyltransferase PlsX [Candidatus Dormibacteria bacterium]